MSTKNVKNIVEVIQLAAAASNAYDLSRADGKIDFKDALNVLPVVPFIDPAVQDIKEVLPEFEDLDQAELDLIVVELGKVGHLGDKVVILKAVKSVLTALHANYQAYLDIRAIKGAQA